MKFIKEKIKFFIISILQKYANFIIEKLEKSKTDEEFEMWFSQALYLDFYCNKHYIFLD